MLGRVILLAICEHFFRKKKAYAIGVGHKLLECVKEEQTLNYWIIIFLLSNNFPLTKRL